MITLSRVKAFLASVHFLIPAMVIGVMGIGCFVAIRFVHDQAEKVLIDHEMLDLFDDTQLSCREIAAEIQGMRDLALRLVSHPDVRRLPEAKQAGADKWADAEKAANELFKQELDTPATFNDLRIEWHEGRILKEEPTIFVNRSNIAVYNLWPLSKAERNVFQERIEKIEQTPIEKN